MTKTNIRPLRVAFTMDWHNEQLCFVFRGASKQAISRAFRNMSGFCCSYNITVEKPANFVNGKYNESIIVIITEPHTDILPEDDWPMMIERFLHKLMPCEVTYYDDINKLLNI